MLVFEGINYIYIYIQYIYLHNVSHVFPYIHLKKKVMGEIPSRHVKVNSVGSKTSSRVIIFHCTRRPHCFLSD